MFTCHDGWHVVEHAGDVTYVRVAVRLRDKHGTYVYRIGTAPDVATCGTIWCYPDKGVPWTCCSCREAISARVCNPFQPEAGLTCEKALVRPFYHFIDPHQRLDSRTRRRHATLAMRAYYARLEHAMVTDGRDADRRS
ncbi:MAG: hypothetical protein ACHQ01_07265 [Candidatus Limnocylindrales bacterium]